MDGSLHSGSRLRAFGFFRKRPSRRLVALALAAVLLLAFANNALRSDSSACDECFYILTGSENRILFDDPATDAPTILELFAAEHGVELRPSFQGSVDTMLDIQAGGGQYDAVWPASSIWMNLGDEKGIISNVQSIMGSPVVFGVKRSKAEQLGWIDTDVTVEDILTAAESGALTYMMSSATQSNSGAMAYLGYLYAFAGHPDVLTVDDLHNPSVQEKTKRLLAEVDRTAAASGFLRDLFLDQYADFDGMVNNESAVITANEKLVERGETDLLQVIYPVDGLALADWPLGYIDRGDDAKSALFDDLQAYLLSPEVQQELLDHGRRTNSFTYPMNAETIDPSVFNPDWGIDVDRVIDPINMPAGPVALEALMLYQTEFRKPSFTAFCLDFSGSMEDIPLVSGNIPFIGGGEGELKEAMSVLLEQEEAARYFLQRTPLDTTVVIPFDNDVNAVWSANGNDAAALGGLLDQINAQDAGGGTNMYSCIREALDLMPDSVESISPAVVLLSDGNSDGGIESVESWFTSHPDRLVPIYAISFGSANHGQLQSLADLSGGDVYDGRDGLLDALRASLGNV